MLELFRSTSRIPAAVPGSPVALDHPGWPESTPEVVLPDGGKVRLRPVGRRDGSAWSKQRVADEQVLAPVEPTVAGSWSAAHSRNAWWRTLTMLREGAKLGRIVPFAIELDGAFAGQVTLGNIQHGVVSECWIGYWVHSKHSGRGLATAAAALGTDHAIDRVRLHRVTATFLPANPASGRVLDKVGFQREGLLRRAIHIDGRWQDHVSVALTDDMYPLGAVARLRRDGLLR